MRKKNKKYVEINNNLITCEGVPMWKIIQIWIECKLSGTTYTKQKL